MVDFLMYDEDCLYDSLVFNYDALEFFSTTGHTSALVPLIVADDILHCIYSELNFAAYFEKDERKAFSYIESLSHLFTLSSDVFYQKHSTQVRYYAISLTTDKADRTIVADTITKAFSKNTTDYIVILFRHERMCMLSFAKKANGFLIFFSDWFDKAGTIEMMNRIEIVNLSLNSSEEFFVDFVYMTARKYYIETISREYAISEWHSTHPLSNDDNSSPWWYGYADELLNAHKIQYGDDYIEYFAADYQSYESDNKDIDFDLLELELEEMIATNVFEMDSDENDDGDDDDFFDDTERINAANIPSDIMSDPVKLLEWLKRKESPDNKTRKHMTNSLSQP